MSTIQAEVRNWLLTQPDWLQEAADLLLKHDSMNDSELQTVCNLLKSPEGRAVTNNRTFDSLVDVQSNSAELRLMEISNVCGIENLSPTSQPLNFGKGNLTVVYGQNGSGKSSYTRIVKKASGKSRATDLKSNVFEDAPSERKCQFTYLSGEKPSTTEWLANGTPIEELRAIDIFDSDVASNYLVKESAASYIPPLVTLFENLATVCGQIKNLLQSEQNQLTSLLPRLPQSYQSTRPGHKYQSLQADMSGDAVKKFLTWTDQDERTLEAIIERLRFNNPAVLAREKRTSKLQVQHLLDGLRKGSTAFRSTNIENMRTLLDTATKKRKIADEAEKLDGVSAEALHAMWEAARIYSQKAYPASAFPVADDEAHCLLCQQELSDSAKIRLREFEKFVQGEVESAAKAARSKYEQALTALPSRPSQQEINALCVAAGLTGQGWEKYLHEFWNKAERAKINLIELEIQGKAVAVPYPAKVLAYFEARSLWLESTAAQCDKDAQGFDRDQAEREKLALEAKKWISQQGAAVSAEIDRLRKTKTYADWKSLVNPRPISIKAGQIAETFITKEYEERFNEELRLLGASRIRVELINTRTEKGIALHQLQLKGAQNSKDMPNEVLSEGERRIISLAAFLADVADKPQAAPFIFDDPISSLDQDYEWKVAWRLAQLANDRQVIVFTHRLSLFGTMEDVAKKISDKWKKHHFRQMCIEFCGGKAGNPAHQSTWDANNKQSNNILLDRLNAAKKIGENGGGDTYRQLVQGICSDFRKLLERTVEDDLLNEVVKRHRRSVTTGGRLGALSEISQSDCMLIDNLMTKYSFPEHSQSREAPIYLPEEAEIRLDLEDLKRWRTGFSEKKKMRGDIAKFDLQPL